MGPNSPRSAVGWGPTAPTAQAARAQRLQRGVGVRRVAIGRPRPGPGGVVQSYEEALNALDMAERPGLDDPVLHAAGLFVQPVLTRDRQAMAGLVLGTLGPLTTGRGGDQPLLDTLTVRFDSGCVAAEAARRLSLSVRAMTYRRERIHQLTGAGPADPAHRSMLQTATIGTRHLDWPAKEL
ncbi:PucR family transcriptional regulator [Streptomyces olivaceoviridis]